MAARLRLKSSFPRLKSLLQRRVFLASSVSFKHTLVEEELEAEFAAELGPKVMVASSGHVDTSKWKKVDSRKLGILLSMIPEAPRTVVKVLQLKGYDAYLVGGCVRDLLLRKIPRDFYVITTATLQEVKEIFHRVLIVARRFPICMVHIKGSIIEVSSFETVARHSKNEEDVQLSKMPKGYDEKDLMRWRNSLKRDFTINSLFYDPFAREIYDYSGGMTDLTFKKLRTLIPANLSFKEDSARILRGIRLAARLGLSFAEDTEKEICNLCGSVATLGKARLMMEMNAMLSYGTAQTSLLLLERFNLLEVLLPFQAAYLANQSGVRNPLMLMELFSNMDMVVSCDQPCGSGLWVSLLAFHLALVIHPQDALVIWTFSSVLYHGNWKEGLKTAKELAGQRVNFVPEILESSNDVTDRELAAKVANFASIIVDSIGVLTYSKGLSKAMGCYQSSPSSSLVFISKHVGRELAQIFGVLMNDVELLEVERHSYKIDCDLLLKGDIQMTRFVLGMVIMDTMMAGVSHHQPEVTVEKEKDLDASNWVAEQVEVKKSTSMVSELKTSKFKGMVKRGSGEPDELNQQKPKKQKQNKNTRSGSEEMLVKEKIGEILRTLNIAQNNQQQMKTMNGYEELLLLLKKSTQDTKPERGKHVEAEAPRGILSVLREAPKIMNKLGAKPTPMGSDLKTAESKDRLKQGSGEPDEELHQQRPNKQKQNKKPPSGSGQKLVKEKIREILSNQDIKQKSQQEKKVVKNIEKVCSSQETLTQKDANLMRGKSGKAEAPEDMANVMKKAPTPKSTKELETPQTKDRVEQESGELDDELYEQNSKKEENKRTPISLRELVKEKIGEIFSTWKDQQQKIVKGVQQLLSLQKALTDKGDMLERRKHGEAEGLRGTLSVLEETPKTMKEPKVGDPKDMLNVRRDFNLFEGEKEPIEKDAKPAMELKVGEQPPQNKPKLSDIFK